MYWSQHRLELVFREYLASTVQLLATPNSQYTTQQHRKGFLWPTEHTNYLPRCTYHLLYFGFFFVIFCLHVFTQHLSILGQVLYRKIEKTKGHCCFIKVKVITPETKVIEPDTKVISPEIKVVSNSMLKQRLYNYKESISFSVPRLLKFSLGSAGFLAKQVGVWVL